MTVLLLLFNVSYYESYMYEHASIFCSHKDINTYTFFSLNNKCDVLSVLHVLAPAILRIA